jgi:hypothetical protein
MFRRGVPRSTRAFRQRARLLQGPPKTIERPATASASAYQTSGDRVKPHNRWGVDGMCQKATGGNDGSGLACNIQANLSGAPQVRCSAVAYSAFS